MQPTALDVIRDEHRALSAMLRSMGMLVDQAHREGHLPPFDVLRAMLLYVDEFPELLHHPKESYMLFPRLRLRCPALSPTLDRLDADHQRGETAIRELEHALLAYDVLGKARRAAFEQALEAYVQGYLAHMALEESAVLPAAREHLTPSDWAELNAAFATNRDPLAGYTADEVYRPLFSKIVRTAPAPVGLG